MLSLMPPRLQPKVPPAEAERDAQAKHKLLATTNQKPQIISKPSQKTETITTMIPSQPNHSGMPTGKKYMGWWGDFGGPKQKGIVQYAISPYRQNPMRNAISHTLFQGYRRTVTQVPYWIVPFAAAYGIIQWADSDNAFRNTKAGHAAGYFP